MLARRGWVGRTLLIVASGGNKGIMVYEPSGASENVNAAGYGPPGGGGYGGGPPPGGGGYGGGPPPGGGGGGYGGPPPGGGGYGPPGGGPPGFGGPPGGAPPGGYGAPPPQGFGPPGGGFPPPGGPMMPGQGGDVNTTLPLVMGIVTVFCCWPAAIPSIIFAVQAKSLRDQGQMEQARSKAKTAMLISGIAGGLAIVGWICYIIFFVVLAAAGAASP